MGSYQLRKPPRHPKRKWFGDEDRSHMKYLQIRDGPKEPAAMDSPVVKAELVPNVVEPPYAKEDATAQVEREAATIIAERSKPKLSPGQLRDKYPRGWMSAPYVKPPIQLENTHGKDRPV